MKGATTLPLVRTMIPPNTTIKTKIGSIQYFLRSRMNSKSSERNIPIAPSELFFHRLRFRPRRVAVDPVTLWRRFHFESQRPPAEYAHDQSCGQNCAEKNQAKQHRVQNLLK